MRQTVTDDPCADLESTWHIDHSLSVTGEDVAMNKILFAMVMCGLAVGLFFPSLVSGIVEWRPGGEMWFRLACLAAGLLVGGFAYGVARFTLYRTNLRLAELATIDPLTGLANQRQFVAILRAELCRSVRDGTPTSLLIADLDHFKIVNDTRGHSVGDEVLAAVARSLREAMRPYDVPCRLGGEEFGIVLPGTGKDQAAEVAERIRAHVAERPPDSLPAVTVSLGVASFPVDARTANLLVTRADDAMYEAKDHGRNTVALWTSDCTPHETAATIGQAPAIVPMTPRAGEGATA